ncbi:pectinesterase-like [Andrographis paniculata]|uniref:pectinesterase-like n=1 Tax=Andrographis paniculata TaxID=175694 RepID=UPI0021E775C1|nr:pectinesterase-like [Andrographis paniculata]
MDTHTSLPLLRFLLLFVLNQIMTTTIANYTSICTLTPYPNLCNSLTTISQQTLVKNVVDLHAASLRVTLARVQEARSHIATKIKRSLLNKLERTAWIDCSELYEDTIHHLNRSIGATSTIDFHDAQTWLSAAIANQETCENGFRDFNLSVDHFRSSPFVGLTKFLSNSLAISKARVADNSDEIIGTNQRRKRRNHRRRYDFRDWAVAQSSDAPMKADIVVARDGTGDYMSISEALKSISKGRKGEGMERIVIYVKKGVYMENVEVKRSMKNIMMIGDGIDRTVVVASKSVQDGFTTFRSATVGVSGDGFVAIGMTFRNAAGAEKHQAVALRSSSDHSIFYKCSFEGYQDTLYVHSQRQFYRDCDIYGTVDFIFGDAASIFQNCNIYIRKPLPHQTNTVTAQGRKSPNENTGIVIQNSVITAASDLIPVQRLYSSYLGRPWKKYSRTVLIKCRIDGVVDPAGWSPWSGDFGLSTLYYAEYMNVGIGARTEARVNWPGFHVIGRAGEAGMFAVGNFYSGDQSWIAAAGVPFTAGV